MLAYVKPCMLMVCALLWVDDESLIYPYPSGLLHWHWGNHMIGNTSYETLSSPNTVKPLI